MENSIANQLPEADSLPDGFFDSFSEPLTRYPPTPYQETQVTDYKDEKLIEVDSRPDLTVDNFYSCKDNRTRTFPVELCDYTSCDSQKLIKTPAGDCKDDSLKAEKYLEISEIKCKSGKRTLITEKEFLEFTMSYQKVLSERDAAISVRDKLESLCRELQHQNKMLTDECKRVSTESQNLRIELSNKFQKAIKDVTDKLEEQRDDSLTQLKENEMLRNQLKQKEAQILLTEQQHVHQLKQKTLELQIAYVKIQQHEEKSVKEHSLIKMYEEQVSQLLETEKNLRLQLTADGEKFQQLEDALVKSNEVFETFKQESEKMTKSIMELKKENLFLKGKTEKSDFTLVKLVEERECMKKQLEKTKNQKEKLESLCRLLQVERIQNLSGQTNADLVPV